MLLEQINQVNDIKKLNKEDWEPLAQEIRDFLIEKISVTGGHLASNLGALTVFLLNGKVCLPLGLPAAACCVAGHFIGSGMVVKNGSRIVRPIILLVLAILFIKILLGL